MLQINFTNEMIFSFPPPNISFLGNEEDFNLLAKTIIELTNFPNTEIEVTSSSFAQVQGENKKVIFKNEKDANKLAVIDGDAIRFILDEKYWDRLFRFFVLMSWSKATYYLNVYEDALMDLDLEQECNFICSSEF